MVEENQPLPGGTQKLHIVVEALRHKKQEEQ
jgi:hypothetical protein